MNNGNVLVIGCLDSSTSIGLKADEKAITAQELSVTIVSTGSAVIYGESIVEILESTPSTLQTQVHDYMKNTDLKVIKIGAMFSAESVEIVSDILRRFTPVQSALDVEPIFKTGPAPKPEMITALRTGILPLTTILSATVPEIKALLDGAGIVIDYPKNMDDVVEMAKKTQTLGPRYVLIKREIFDEVGKTTTLQYVLCGDGEPIIVNSRVENPKSVKGASYSIPPVIAANLAKGQSVPHAVSSAYKFVGEMIKGGSYFD